MTVSGNGKRTPTTDFKRKAAIPEINEIAEWLDQLCESTLANCFVTHWRITIMLVAEGHRFRQEIKTLAVGSPARFLRILSYRLANLVTKTKSDPKRCMMLHQHGRLARAKDARNSPSLMTAQFANSTYRT